MKKRILVIDDDINIFNLIFTFLSGNYELYYAKDVEEGKNKTIQFLPHLVFLDINLEGEIGFKYLQWKNQQQELKSIKVIVISSDAFTKNVSQSIGLGAIDFLCKPLVNSVIIAKTKKAFLDRNFFLKKIEKDEDQIATLEIAGDIVNRSDVAILVESPLRASKDVVIKIENESYYQRGRVSRSKSGRSLFNLYKLGDTHDAKQSFSDSKTYEIEDKLKSRSPLIYLLDDDHNFLTLLKLFFDKIGVRLEHFDNVEAFEKKIKNVKPDLCLIDLTIKTTNDSFGLIERLVQKKTSAPIIVVSATSDQAALLHCLDLGATDFLVKPLKRNFLLEKISALIIDDIDTVYKKKQLLPVKTNLEFGCAIIYFDEIGVMIHSRLYLAKGNILKLKTPLLEDTSISIMVIGVELVPEKLEYKLYGEYYGIDNSTKARILGKIFSKYSA